MKIAITGASGQLGKDIIKATIAVTGKDQIVGIARNLSRVEDLGIDIRQADYTDRLSYDSALKGIDCLLLVSGMDAPDKRIDQHRNVIAAAKDNKVKKIVYTSVQGADTGTDFSPIIQSNRQTEKDIQESGIQWVIGRNGTYIEPDVLHIDKYREAGEIANSAGDGKCGYTTRPELAFAYAQLLTDVRHDGHIYNLHGDAITQQQLTDYLNLAFETDLVYRAMCVEEYRNDRVAEYGDFFGSIIAGIYQGIRNGHADNPSDFKTVTGRSHQSWDEYFNQLKQRLTIQ